MGGRGSATAWRAQATPTHGRIALLRGGRRELHFAGVCDWYASRPSLLPPREQTAPQARPVRSAARRQWL